MSDNIFLKALEKQKLTEEIVNKNEIYVYHCAKYENLQSIGEVGFERYFTAGGVGNAYGPGIYSTFDLNSSVINARRGEYGNVILKCRLKSLRNFLIYTKDVAKQIYGRDDIDFQLRKILKPEDYNQLKAEGRKPNSKFWMMGDNIYKLIINDPSLNIQYTSYCCHAADWYGGKNASFDNSIDGFVFNGPHDGYVCIIRDFKIAYPVEVSYSVRNGEYARTGQIRFEPFKTHEFFEDFAKNDVDLVRQLKKLDMLDQFDTYTCPKCGGDGHTWNGSYCASCFGTGKKHKVPEYFSNNFARVEINGKYNYLYRKNYTHGVISPVGFDEAPITFDKNNQALVTYNGQNFIIKLTEPPIKFSVYTTDGKYLCNLRQLGTFFNAIETDDDFDWS